MLFLITHKLPFCWECSDHGECDHTIQLKRYNSRWHEVTVRVVCCACYDEARHNNTHTYPYTEFDLNSTEWSLIVDELKIKDAMEN